MHFAQPEAYWSSVVRRCRRQTLPVMQEQCRVELVATTATFICGEAVRPFVQLSLDCEGLDPVQQHLSHTGISSRRHTSSVGEVQGNELNCLIDTIKAEKPPNIFTNKEYFWESGDFAALCASPKWLINENTLTNKWFVSLQCNASKVYTAARYPLYYWQSWIWHSLWSKRYLLCHYSLFYNQCNLLENNLNAAGRAPVIWISGTV